jgi:hypothetical protein
MNHGLVNQRGNYAVEDYARNMFRSLDAGALVLTSQYGFFTAPAFYLQAAEGERPDVRVVDTQLLKFPWYYAWLERKDPDMIEASRPEVDAFLRAASVMEAETSSDSAAFMRFALAEYSNVVRSLLDHALERGPVYVTAEMTLDPRWGFRKVPSGLVFRLYRNSGPPAPKWLEFVYRPLPGNNPLSRVVSGRYGVGWYNQGVYRALAARDTAGGLAFLRAALAAQPDLYPAREWLQRLGGI